jgi:hypothetical protein
MLDMAKYIYCLKIYNSYFLLCSYSMKDKEPMYGDFFKQQTGNIYLCCKQPEWTKKWWSWMDSIKLLFHQATWLNRCVEEASVPYTDLCWRILSIPCRRSPHDCKIGPKILCSCRGKHISIFSITSWFVNGVRWVKLSTLLWINCRSRPVVHLLLKSNRMPCLFQWNTSLWDMGFTDLPSMKLAPGVHW